MPTYVAPNCIYLKKMLIYVMRVVYSLLLTAGTFTWRRTNIYVENIWSTKCHLINKYLFGNNRISKGIHLMLQECSRDIYNYVLLIGFKHMQFPS